MYAKPLIFYKDCKHLYVQTIKYAHMTTNIRISKENRNQLTELKIQKGYKNLDEVITYLIEVNKKYEDSTIVRLVKE